MLEVLFEPFLDTWDSGAFALPFLIFTGLSGFIASLPLLLTVGIELLVLKKCRTAFAKWILPLLSAAGILACDIAMRFITGWDRLVPMIGYGIFFWNLAASLLCILIVTLIRKRKTKLEK